MQRWLWKKDLNIGTARHTPMIGHNTKMQMITLQEKSLVLEHFQKLLAERIKEII